MDAGAFDLARIGRDLPFAQALPQFVAAVTTPGAAVVVQAPPGTGKTTLVPAASVAAGTGRVVVTQPRRIAVRAAARRLAHLDGTPLGERVGFSVRGERVLGARAQIEFVTPGLLLRRLLADPELTGVGVVVLDEVHERQLDTDLLLALLTDLRELRDDLSTVAMSATLDAARYADLLERPGRPATVVSVEAPAHPLEVRWAPSGQPRRDHRGVRRDFLDHVASQAASAHQEAIGQDPGVDALVFLPGVREVEHVVAALRDRAPHTEAIALHGGAPVSVQDRAVSGRGAGDPPRIVVSTSLAESSLTVPGVRLVIDSGLAREPRVDRARGMSGLVTVATSRATALQRAGRATRLGPGTVVRCYEQSAFEGAAAHLTPEIAIGDLTAAMLLLAAWGTPAGRGLRWLTPPPAPAVADAIAVLQSLDAVDEAGRITADGRRLAGLPLDPRWGRALLATAEAFGATEAAEVVAACSADLRAEGADLAALVRSLRSRRHPRASTWQREASRLRRLVDVDTAVHVEPDGRGVGPLAHAVLRARPERVARLVEATTYQLAQGTRAALPASSGLVGEPWLAVAEVDRTDGSPAAGTGAIIRSAVALTEAQALAGLAHEELVAEFVDGRVRGRRVRALGAIELNSTPVALTADEGTAAVAAALRREGLELLTFSPAATSLRRRLAHLHRERGAPWPDVGDDALLQRWPEWLAPELRRLADGEPAARIDLLDAVRRLLPWPEAARLDDVVPTHLTVPSGRAVALRYPEIDHDGPVVAEVKLQECFGLAESPRIVGVPVLFHLLSPAGRPLAVTADLASFWSGPYTQVRAEMRGRYPKHPWPEDPWSAVATRETNRRR